MEHIVGVVHYQGMCGELDINGILCVCVCVRACLMYINLRYDHAGEQIQNS